jgi:hypothetical protein
MVMIALAELSPELSRIVPIDLASAAWSAGFLRPESNSTMGLFGTENNQSSNLQSFQLREAIDSDPTGKSLRLIRNHVKPCP